MDSQQTTRTNFLFVHKTPLSGSLSRNPGDEGVELRRHVQRVSRTRARLKALQGLRSGRSLVQPLTARRASPTRADLGTVGHSNPRAENCSGLDQSGVVSSEQCQAHSEHTKACDCPDLPTPCSCSLHVLLDFEGAGPNTQVDAEYSRRQPPSPLQPRQPRFNEDAANFAYIGSSADDEEPPDELVSRELRRPEGIQHVYRSKNYQCLPVLDHTATLQDPQEISSDFTGLPNAQPLGTYNPACKPTLDTYELYPGTGRIGETTGVYNSTRHSKEDAMSITSERLNTVTSVSRPSTALLLRQNTPNAWLGAGRIDPFSTFPVNLDKISQKCVDHFIHEMPFIEFNIDEGALLNPNRHVAFASALSSPAAFHAIVATGAVHLASLYREKTSVVATHHLAQSLRLLREGLQTSNRNTWAGTVQAMAELAATEEFRGHQESSRIHLTGLRDFVLLHGGVEALELTSRVQLLSCYVCISVSASYLPKIRIRGRFKTHSPNAVAFLLNQIAESPSEFSGNIRRHLSDILAHVHEFMKLMSRIMEQTYPGCNSSGVRRILASFFRPGNGLHDILSMSAEDRMRSGGLGPKGNHRMSCLLLITLKLLGLVDNEQAAMGYLGKLQKLFQKYDLKAHPNPRLLHFLLLRDCASTQVEDTSMSWKVVSLMQVYKLLSTQTSEYVNNTILDFLTSCGTYITNVTLDLKVLLRDVFSALVCSETVEGAAHQNQN
jgi:hypothetical protein